MSQLDRQEPNAEQIEYWNDAAGAKWVAFQDFLDAQIRGFGHQAMARAALQPGERVLDVGCGCGETTIEIGRRVGPGGAVIGVDISGVMLRQAERNARTAEVANVRFANVDAQTHSFDAEAFDVIFSRFGVMFFSDPPAAFANLRTALHAGGRVSFACWRELPANPWAVLPLMAAAQHIGLPPIPPEGAPGPFAFADQERVRTILAQAGFTDIECAAKNEMMTIGGQADIDQAVEFLMELGPTGRAMRDAPAEKRPAVAAAIRDTLLPFNTPEGVRMQGGVWIVSARRA